MQTVITRFQPGTADAAAAVGDPVTGIAPAAGNRRELSGVVPSSSHKMYAGCIEASAGSA
jgi:hypothetical protein